ncbi:hypothetical protein C5B85_17900 [Pseudoclavibacter sp. AY1F1]|uniref:DUF3500 domain-containing protein n=1 Tax=Pseudoclavibacter sp. AY1F1 TaxID=2080583 RepID=UPI000CE74991|nr:DUF3500 domain-containing protein [Pseudoclavibacter sp. AY1F1]PPF41972.1 hypothetical protein C5B85_17900 [Pseudoclavibacter sp. AY1F1]
MENIKLVDVNAKRRSGRKRTAWIASVLLAGSLVLSGCAAVDSAASAVTATATSSAVATPESTGAVADVSAGTTAQTIADTTSAAEAFMATLAAEQVEQLTYAYDDETKSTSWSNFPVTFVERAGLNLTDLTEVQRAAALKVLEALLSDEGYTTVTGIMNGDQYLLDNSSSTEDSLGQYYIAFLGDASDSSAWEVQFGGHHLGINATLDGASDAITFAPTHLGVQPAVYTDEDGNEVQPFAAIYESAFAFYDSLTAEQQAKLYQGEQIASMVCAPGSTCDYPTGTGLAGSELTDEQKQLLLDVIANWVGLADEETTANALAEIEATLDDTYINWSGETVYDMTQGDGIYFQISGPKAYVEFAGQQGSAGADVSGVNTSGWGHVHTIYRDPTNDYANSVAQGAATGMGGGGAPSDGATPPNG